ncbi:MAG: metallophosphoesterase [Candidatus Micrarchaeota archaeon]
MKIAIFSDPHLGYARFEQDSYVQAERAVQSASERADLILCAGDIFDIKIPKLETLKKAVDIFRKAKVPVFAIHGNHERRARDLVNPAQLLQASAGLTLLHATGEVFDKNGEKVQVFGIGSVPEEYATDAVKKAMENFRKDDGAFTILMLHQSIKELIPGGGEEELSLEYLETLPFDLIVNGHIHETITKLGGRFVIPGSTVITQLKKDEMNPKGYFLYDTKTRKAEFIPIESRKFFYERLEFSGAGEAEVGKAVRETVERIKGEHPDSVIAIKIDGTLKEGLSSSDLKVDGFENVFIENRLNSDNLGAKLEKIRTSREESLSMREMALRELRAKTAGKVTLFDTSEIFEKLLQGPEEAMEYLERNKKEKQQ